MKAKADEEKERISNTIKSIDNQIEMCNRINNQFGNTGFKPFRTDELTKRKQKLIKLLEI